MDRYRPEAQGLGTPALREVHTLIAALGSGETPRGMMIKLPSKEGEPDRGSVSVWLSWDVPVGDVQS